MDYFLKQEVHKVNSFEEVYFVAMRLEKRSMIKDILHHSYLVDIDYCLKQDVHSGYKFDYTYSVATRLGKKTKRKDRR